MFAKVFPILKLPRRFEAFDYRLPDDSHFAIGDIISIPFRHRSVLGVIDVIQKTTNEKRTIEVSNASPVFNISPSHLSYLKTIATNLGQSVSSILSIAFEGISDRTGVGSNVALKNLASSFSVDPHTIDVVKSMLSIIQKDRESSFAIDDETSAVLAHALCKTPEGQALILVPRERDAQFFKQLLNPFSPAVLTGKTTSFERNSIIRSWKLGKHRLLIGTRQTTLIEPQNLSSVLVFQSACEDHKSLFRNPHINAIFAAQTLAELYNARLIMTDPLPPISTIALKQLPEKSAIELTDSTPVIIDTTIRGENSAYPLLSQTLLEAIKLALHSQKKVLLCLNRKGVAKRMECKACGHVPFCGTCGNLPIVRLDDLLCGGCGAEMWKPTSCPACGSPKIGPRSIGGARIVDDLKKAFPDVTIGHIEKGRIDNKANIIVATEYFWSSVIVPFQKYGFGLVAELLADVGFIPGDFCGVEKTARKICRLQNLAQREHVKCIIQTVARDRLLSLLGTSHVYNHERSIREQYTLPPFGVIITFENAILEELPENFRSLVTNRHGVLTAKVDHPTFDTWKEQFSNIPDHINIRIDR
ncbi:MAG: hypothetical protein WCT28_01655 [Patescibacteria group bacterium]